MAGNDQDDAVSAYEAKRLARVQQNQQMLQSLGIALPPRERKRRVSTRDESAKPEKQRRSSRLQNDAEEEEKKMLQARGKLSRQSLLALDMDMAAFHDRWLGKQIWANRQQDVMEAMCPLHIPVMSNARRVCQWRNGVVLFEVVNGASGYDTSFTEVSSPDTCTEEPSAVHFRWLANRHQSAGSPIIARLVAAHAGDHSLWLENAPPRPEPAVKTEPALLFVRFSDGPFVYCGRVGYLGHLPGASPIEFRFQLLDLDRIQWCNVKQLLAAQDQQAEDAVIL